MLHRKRAGGREVPGNTCKHIPGPTHRHRRIPGPVEPHPVPISDYIDASFEKHSALDPGTLCSQCTFYRIIGKSDPGDPGEFPGMRSIECLFLCNREREPEGIGIESPPFCSGVRWHESLHGSRSPARSRRRPHPHVLQEQSAVRYAPRQSVLPPVVHRSDRELVQRPVMRSGRYPHLPAAHQARQDRVHPDTVRRR